MGSWYKAGKTNSPVLRLNAGEFGDLRRRTDA